MCFLLEFATAIYFYTALYFYSQVYCYFEQVNVVWKAIKVFLNLGHSFGIWRDYRNR